jgi:hypothetical protein
LTLLTLTVAIFLTAAIDAVGQPAHPSPPPAERTKVVILGVSHSAQLLAETYQPAVFRAFFTRVSPEAICVERSPEEFARLDFYEFTYEAQFISVPYAKAHGIALCPIDWLPQPEDSLLAWGMADIEAPPLREILAGFKGS